MTARRECELEIASLAAGGDGVARDPSGRIVFVPGSAPGDRVRALLREERGSFARARVLSVLRPSPERVDAPCSLFARGACGGCQWQHVSVACQRRAKMEIVRGALRHFLRRGLRLHDIDASVPAYGWRRRARLHWARRPGADAAAIGFFAPRSHDVVDLETCVQLAAPLEAAVAALRDKLASSLFGRGEIELLAGHVGQCVAVIRGRCPAAAARSVVGAGPIVGVRLGAQRWGDADVELEPGFRGRGDRFAQSSLAGNQALLAAVDRLSGPRSGRRIIEFFAGSGNLSRVLADGAAELWLVDRKVRLPAGSSSGAGAGAAARAAVRVWQGEAEGIARQLVQQAQRFDLAVLDPPRRGARDLMEPLAALAPERILYVSCDPATLARDVGYLAECGYAVVEAQPLDLMPQTAHVEVVVKLALRRQRPGDQGAVS